MKKSIALLLLSAILLTSCTNTVEPVDETNETEGQNIERLDSETESESESKDTEESETPIEETLILGGSDSETIAETDPPQTPPNDEQPTAGNGVITMTIPTDYKQVYKAFEKCAENVYLYDMVEVEAEIAVEEAVSIDGAADVVYEASQPTAAADSIEDFGSYPISKNEEDFSKTNTQIADIDEGDIVKTDGEYIYVLKDEEILLILSADGAETKVISETKLDMDGEDRMWAEELYICGDTLLILSGSRNHGINPYSVKITAFDVSDPTDPDRIAYNGQDGNYVTSRLVGDDLYIVSTFSIPTWSNFEENDYESYIPGLYENDVKELVDPSCIVYPPEVKLASYAVISRYDADSGTLEKNKSILGAGDTVYMSHDYLYLACSYYYSDESEPYKDGVYTVTDYNSGNRTEIFKLSLEDDLRVAAVGEVEGTLLNQFSLDEYNGNLRVVTTYNNNSYSTYTDDSHGFTNYKWGDSENMNGLFIFDENMEIIGKIDGLAEDERVYSVRFTGDVGYFVTFRTVDPLFTVDLSDPTEPKIMSELKIPGFSEYLHPYSDGLLFGLGQSADENTGRTRGMKLSMFDVSDPYDVTEKHKLSLEFSYSEALNNHKAILISAEKNLIGFPISGGYVIYGYGDDGFYERSRVELTDIKWNGNSRGLYVGEYVYIVTQTCTLVLDMQDFTIASVVHYPY